MTKYSLYDELGQFIAIPETVIEMIPEIGSDAALMYLYLRYRTNAKRGQAWPGYERMCADLKWGRRRIKNAIAKLEEHELVHCKKRFGKSTIYTLKRPPDVGGISEESPSSSAMEILKDPDSSSAMEPQYFHNATPVVPKRDLNQIKFNQIDINQTELKDSSAKKIADNGRPPKEEYNRLRKLAEERWYELTNCPELGTEKEKNKRVWMPLIQLLDLVKWNENDILALLQATYNRMKGLTYDAPDQWLKTARSIVGEANRGAFKPSYSFEDEMQKFKAQFEER